MSKAAMKLLRDALGNCSGIDTSMGTAMLWAELERAGLVERQKYRSPFGHPFSFNITPKGRKALVAAELVKNPDVKEIKPPSRYTGQMI